jgi:hypothetical protein
MNSVKKLALVGVLVLCAMTAVAQQKQFRVVSHWPLQAGRRLSPWPLGTDITVLAQSELRHPAEYELKPFWREPT